MLKKFLQGSIYLIALTVVSTVGAVLIKEALAVWTGPTANPPDGNVSIAASNNSGWTDYGLKVGLSTPSDYVGIGTDDANKQLHLYQMSGDNSEIDIQSIAGTNKHWAIYHDRATQDFRIWNNDPTGEKNVLVIDNATGNIGIGTTDPGTFKLNVNGKIRTLTPAVGDDNNTVATKGYVDAATIATQSYQAGTYYSEGGNPNFCRQIVVAAGGTGAISNIHDGLTCDSSSVCVSGVCVSSTQVCYTDADTDGYGTGSPLSGSACTTGSKSINNTDCNDGSASVWRLVTGYKDNDGDGYGAGTYYTSSCQGAGSWVANNTDCYDSNGNAYPGQSNYFSVNRGDGSYDYNCDGSATLYINKVTTLPASCLYNTPAIKSSGWVSGVPACGVSGTLRYMCALSAGCGSLSVSCNSDAQNDNYMSGWIQPTDLIMVQPCK
ncbi:hypothetical protein A2477_00930 [Candidatus Falkowbacteria bacterium RIFOXYC2_FULL_47_12]|uniref:Uncharacterized protein n=2 Tax=Candidatus Falkowiibacteriota TaxID=1752728 RepID=A0A1F5TLS5_9BACT|nr:MAG: hypothetical protein A2242_01600 [Candidatus Falkowbacteria bacterium RIFOXYA2_FULL_47_9]OGF39806.1 MAG: hypothetical protein A2477_00930 [Candidatus Falkowbacteria bacterium RIFOXYC2_FULL_47_12]